MPNYILVTAFFQVRLIWVVNMFDFLENILFELKNVPGLAFLRKLHADLRHKRTRLRTKMQILKNQKNDFQKLSERAGKLTQSAKGSKGRKD